MLCVMLPAMELFVGTSGYAYKEWRGNFYPEKIAPTDMLSFYAARIPSVEINNTFYRLPKPSVLENWAAQVPDTFRFVIKASQRITHRRRLVGAEDETEYLLNTTATLGERLGAILFQLPPNLKKDLQKLETFLDILPEGTHAAFEFRHDSWFTDEIYEILRRRDCALCAADTEERDTTDIVSTASWGYLRLRKPEYSDSEIAAWVTGVRAQEWSRAFVFFKHEDEGAGPQLAIRFIEIAG